MKISIVLVAAAFLCLVAFPTTTVGKYLKGWPSPSDSLRNEMFMSTSHNFNYGDSKVWKCTYSNGSRPAISISTPSPSTPSPSPSTPKTSPPPPTPSPPPPTPKKSPPTPTPSIPPPTPKISPSLPPPTPKISPSLPPPTPKKSPSPSPPSGDESSSPSQPSYPPPEQHHSHHHRGNRWEHFGSCMRDMGPLGVCRGQMEFSFFTKMFQVSKYCCNLVVNMKNECDDVIWGYFTDPFFLPLVRCTCHVTY